MNLTRRIAILMFVFALQIAALRAQDSRRGIVMPFTVTGGLLVSDRPKAADPEASEAMPGFRAVIYPGLKINSRWSVQSNIQVHSEPFFYYEAFYPRKDVKARVDQLFVGYNWSGEDASIGVKAGKLTTAFGSFPLRYSDKVNPLLDQPLAYGYSTKLRPDQIPCGSEDLAHQVTYPVYVHHYCGGATSDRNGMVPVTLYGLPGAEISASWHKVDGRFQLTNSSPANPQDLRSGSQHVQWTAGSGYTIRQGFRIGLSAFRGPFLEKDASSLLDSGTDAGDHPATAIGADLQWGHGRWAANAEWIRVAFHYPGFSSAPVVSTVYVELKATLNPRFYAAMRSQYENHSRVKDAEGIEKEHFNPNRQSYEFALGYHLNRAQTLKFGYEWLKTAGASGRRDNVIGIQVVTSVYSLSKIF